MFYEDREMGQKPALVLRASSRLFGDLDLVFSGEVVGSGRKGAEEVLKPFWAAFHSVLHFSVILRARQFGILASSAETH